MRHLADQKMRSLAPTGRLRRKTWANWTAEADSMKHSGSLPRLFALGRWASLAAKGELMPRS
jgi:hypothetical protein